jgi:hypothetical protein
MSSALENLTFLPHTETDNDRHLRRMGIPPMDTFRIVGGQTLACTIEEFSLNQRAEEDLDSPAVA